MPPACSRLRSRRARSSGGRSSLPAPSSAAGSATRRSAPVARSSVHRQVTGSVPPRLRRKTTRAPSGEIVKPRGAPSVKRRVRAWRRGKLSVTPGSLPSRRAPPPPRRQFTQGTPPAVITLVGVAEGAGEGAAVAEPVGAVGAFGVGLLAGVLALN